MLCEKCHSKNIIEVQGKFLCVGCGNQVKSEGIVNHPKPLENVVAHDQPNLDVVPKKKKLGRPKAGRLDAVKPVQALQPAIAQNTSISHDIQPVSMANAMARELVAPAEVVVATRQDNDRAITSREKSLTRDISAKKAAPLAVESTKQLKFARIESASIVGRFKKRHFILSLVPATILGMILSLVMYIFLGDKALNGELSKFVIIGGVQLTLIAAIYYASRSLAHGAIMHGSARHHDHRPAPPHVWLNTSAQSFWPRVGIDVIFAGINLFLLAGVMATYYYGGTSQSVAGLGTVTILFGIFLVFMYALVGNHFAHNLSRATLIFNNLNISKAIKLGWGMSYRHPELIIFSVLSILIEAVLLIPIVITVIVASVYLQGVETWIIALLSGVITILVGVSIGTGNAIWWQAIYRRLSVIDQQKDVDSVRPTIIADSKNIALAATFILALCVVTAVWPLVGQDLIRSML